MNVIRSIAHILGIIYSLKMISNITIFLSLFSYIYFGNAITARRVFIVLTYYNILGKSLLTEWPVTLAYV